MIYYRYWLNNKNAIIWGFSYLPALLTPFWSNLTSNGNHQALNQNSTNDSLFTRVCPSITLSGLNGIGDSLSTAIWKDTYSKPDVKTIRNICSQVARKCEAIMCINPLERFILNNLQITGEKCQLSTNNI
uniref:Uncharacterized protein n=1 Tax=Glossina brevipalpis TaxID=37001 RepID=A0A1A9WMC5_9MUSC